MEKREEKDMCRSSQHSTLVNVIENDVCALSMPYLLALKTRVRGEGYENDRIVCPVGNEFDECNDNFH